MGVFGVTAKCGPCDSTASCAVDRGLLDKFTAQHLFLTAENCTVEIGSWFEWPLVPILPLWLVLPLWYFLHHKFSNFISGIPLHLYA